MPLPIATLATGEVTVHGEVVPFRAMSRNEVIELGKLEGQNDQAEIWMLQCGTGCTDDEARAFRDGNDAITAGLLIDAIVKLSGIGNEAPLQCPECGHEAPSDDFAVKDGNGDPKSSASKRSTKGR